MALYKDLSTCDYIPGAAEVAIAVGWLEGGFDFPTGPTPEDDYSRLKELSRGSFMPIVSAGAHQCTVCQFDGPGGHGYLLIPGDGHLYAAPKLIVHYIAVHSYRPPEEFLVAVRLCPSMATMEYKRKFLANGGREFMRNLKRLGDE